MLTEDLDHTIDTWIEAINRYNYDQLCVQPAENSWSLGQVCMHLIDATGYYLDEIETCLSKNDDADETMSEDAQEMFDNNSFPNEKLDNPSNINTPQPTGKEELLEGFMHLKKELKAAAGQIATSSSYGKTKHPGLDYFNAAEWLQFAEMHLRHHLKQKESIDHFLNTKYEQQLQS